MQPAYTEEELLDRIQEHLFAHGYPLQRGYLATYVSFFINAYNIGGPSADRILDVMNARGAADNPHAQTNLPALHSAWTAWWKLVEEGTSRSTLQLGPKGPYDDF